MNKLMTLAIAGMISFSSLAMADEGKEQVAPATQEKAAHVAKTTKGKKHKKEAAVKEAKEAPAATENKQ